MHAVFTLCCVFTHLLYLLLTSVRHYSLMSRPGSAELCSLRETPVLLPSAHHVCAVVPTGAAGLADVHSLWDRTLLKAAGTLSHTTCWMHETRASLNI